MSWTHVTKKLVTTDLLFRWQISLSSRDLFWEFKRKCLNMLWKVLEATLRSPPKGKIISKYRRYLYKYRRDLYKFRRDFYKSRRDFEFVLRKSGVVGAHLLKNRRTVFIFTVHWNHLHGALKSSSRCTEIIFTVRRQDENLTHIAAKARITSC